MEEIRVVTLLPDEDEVGGGHEDGDEVAAWCGAREGIRPNAEPTLVFDSTVVLPELLVLREPGVDDEGPTGPDAPLLHATRLPVRKWADRAL
jgi:hypothetical protein